MKEMILKRLEDAKPNHVHYDESTIEEFELQGISPIKRIKTPYHPKKQVKGVQISPLYKQKQSLA